MAAPLALRLTARQARTLAGEGIVMDLGIRVAVGLDMETPELNRDRTTIHVQSSAPGGKERRLTGTDHMRLHNVHPLSQVGQLMHVDAGRAWQAELNLFSYTAALPAGRYTISVSYRYGQTAGETVRSNTVDLEVAPAKLASVEYRWLGGGEARETLASVWVAYDGAKEEWFYQLANRRDPAAVGTAVRVGCPARKPGARPMVAHLNDIHTMHFQKYLVWEQDGELGAQQVHTAGRSGEARFVRHGLRAGAQLVDPPLQLHHGGMLALLTGIGPDGKPACSLVSLPDSGAGEARVSALPGVPENAVALWPADERVPALFVRMADGRAARTSGKGAALFGGRAVGSMMLSQWMGNGHLIGFYQDNERLHPFHTDCQKSTEALQAPAAYELQRLPAKPGKFVAAAHREPGGVALLFESGTGWLVLDGGQSYVVPPIPGVDARPMLLPGGKSLFVVRHHPERGFLSQLVGTAPVESHF